MPRLIKIINRYAFLVATATMALLSASSANESCPQEWSAFARATVPNDGVPNAVALKTLNLERIGGQVFKELRKGNDAAYSYVVDRDGHIWAVQGDAGITQNQLWVVQNSGDGVNSFLVQEAGAIKFDRKANRFTLEPKYTIGLSDEEAGAIARDADLHAAGQKVVRAGDQVAEKSANKTRVVKCLDVMNDESNGKRLILDRWIGDNANLAAVVSINEAVGSGYFSTDKDRRLLAANVVGTQVSTVLNGYLGTRLTFSEMSAAKNYATRFGVGAGLIVVQGGIYRAALGEDGGSDSLKLSAFDTAHWLARIPINSKLDTAIMKTLPARLFEACTQDKNATIFIRPRMVRIYERLASSVIYYTLQKAVIGSGKK